MYEKHRCASVSNTLVKLAKRRGLSMDLGVRAREGSVNEILGPGQELRMPPYQRSYSWTKREAMELFNDLREASEMSMPHFVGAIVIVNQNPDRPETLEIVDGQQRLTTITIMLAVLRDREKDPTRKAEIHALIADAARPMFGEKSHWRLSLNHMDGPFFRASIQNPDATNRLEHDPGESESQRRILQNAVEIASAVDEMSDAERRRFAETLMKGCSLVRVRVQDRDAGFRVFRVLNTRGKEPNAHDIIKTELFERAKFTHEEAEKYSEEWLEHEAILGGSPFDDLLRQIRSIHDKTPKGDLVAGFRKAILGQMSARTFLTERLPRYVEAYRRVSTGDAGDVPHATELRARLNRLRSLEHYGWRAPALHFIATRGLDDPSALSFFEGLERLGFTIQLIIHDRVKRTRRYRRVIESVTADRGFFKDRSDPFTISRDEGRKIRERLLGRFATFGQRRSMTLSLNAALEGGESLPPESDATVEHVLPRNIPEQSHWFTIWPDPQKRRELCDTLGNFVLLSHKLNQKADRMDFDSKKKIYFDNAGGTEFALTRDLADRNTWTPEDVRRRTQQLADILANFWKIP